MEVMVWIPWRMASKSLTWTPRIFARIDTMVWGWQQMITLLTIILTAVILKQGQTLSYQLSRMMQLLIMKSSNLILLTPLKLRWISKKIVPKSWALSKMTLRVIMIQNKKLINKSCRVTWIRSLEDNLILLIKGCLDLLCLLLGHHLILRQTFLRSMRTLFKNIWGKWIK